MLMLSMLKNISKKIFNALLLNKLTIVAFNEWYENASNKAAKKIEPRLQPPSFDYTWKIKIDESIVRFTYKKGENREIFHFPLSYKKNDPPIRKLEAILHDHYPPKNYYFDIGANFGLRSLYYLSKGRPCVLFEPNPSCNSITDRLIRQNDFKSANVVSKIVGSENKTTKFYLSYSGYVSSVNRGHVEGANDLKSEIIADQIMIDSFLESANLKGKVNIVKIDVEGFEYNVCLGAQRLLQSENITLLIEVFSGTDQNQQLFNLLNKMGFIIFGIAPEEELRLIPCKDNFNFEYSPTDFLATNDKTLLDKLKTMIYIYPKYVF